jgi:hypothetical protein
MGYGRAGSSGRGHHHSENPAGRGDRAPLSNADIDSKDNGSTIFLRNNAIVLLTKSVRRGVQTAVPLFINKVVNDLMRFAPAEPSRAMSLPKVAQLKIPHFNI